MTGLGTTVTNALDALDAELLLVVPGALAIAGIVWGGPLLKSFFKKLAR